MKKILAALLVLALVAPAMAAVNFDIVNNGDGTASVTINTNGAVVRGVGLSVVCSNGAKLVDLTGYNPATNAFNTCIDYAFVDGAGYTVGKAGSHPYALATGAGVAAVNATTFSLSMGVLDQAGAQAGFNGSAILATIKTGAGDVCIDLDSLRGGVVGDGTITTNLDGVLSICKTITAATTCYDRLTAAEKVEWNKYIAAGKTAAQMEVWCNRFQCRGDFDNAAYGADWRVYQADLDGLIANWKLKSAAANPAADFDHTFYGADWRVYSGDLDILIANWKGKSTTLVNCPGYVAP